MKPERRDRFEEATAGWLGALVIAAAFVALAFWSWGKWSDVQVDFGAELYVPWQILEGKVLYRDIAYRHGPLPPHLNALWFSLFGVSLRTLVWCNLVILAGVVAMTWRVLVMACGRTTATVACLVLLAMFGFSQYTVVGNYNYVTPYSHAQTHGLALALAMILALTAALRGGGLRSWAAAGAFLGCVFLTKLELFLPALAAIASAGLLLWRWRRPVLRPFLVLVVAAMLPPLACFGWLALRTSAPLAIRGVLGNWAYLGGLGGDDFYLWSTGLDAWRPNAIAMGRALGCAGVVLGLAVFADLRLPERFRKPGVAAILGLALFATLAIAAPAWPLLARALPPVTLGISLALMRRSFRDQESPVLSLALYSVFALVLLSKMLLRARFGQYGFVLAMPATLLLVATITNLIPSRLPGRGALLRAVAIAATAACVASLLALSNDYYRLKTLEVGWGGDQILARGRKHGRRAGVIERGLQHLRTALPRDASLLVWPQGVGINYWLRRENPTRFYLFLPTEVTAFGEDTILRNIRSHAPDFIVLLHREHEDFGAGPFGASLSNGRRFTEWVDQNYVRSASIGAEPFEGRAMGMVILRRRSSDGRVGRVQ